MARVRRPLVGFVKCLHSSPTVQSLSHTVGYEILFEVKTRDIEIHFIARLFLWLVYL